MSDDRSTVLVAGCKNYREDLDAACTGRIRFRWGQSQATCNTCGAYCGIAVAAWERVEATDQPAPAGDDELRARIAATLHMGLDDASPNDPLADDEGRESWVQRVQEWADWIHEQYAPHLAAQPAPAGDDELRKAYDDVVARLRHGVNLQHHAVRIVMAEYNRRGAIERRARAVRDGRADDFLFGDGATAELVVEVARYILGER